MPLQAKMEGSDLPGSSCLQAQPRRISVVYAGLRPFICRGISPQKIKSQPSLQYFSQVSEAFYNLPKFILRKEALSLIDSVSMMPQAKSSNFLGDMCTDASKVSCAHRTFYVRRSKTKLNETCRAGGNAIEKPSSSSESEDKLQKRLDSSASSGWKASLRG
jgi:hypothetical protein